MTRREEIKCVRVKGDGVRRRKRGQVERERLLRGRGDGEVRGETRLGEREVRKQGKEVRR